MIETQKAKLNDLGNRLQKATNGGRTLAEISVYISRDVEISEIDVESGEVSLYHKWDGDIVNSIPLNTFSNDIIDAVLKNLEREVLYMEKYAKKLVERGITNV